MKIDHLSNTQIEMYGKCGQQYYYVYPMGLRVPPGIALIQGKAVHKSREHVLNGKMVGGICQVDETKELALAECKKGFEGEIRTTEKDMTPGEATDQAVALAELDYMANLIDLVPEKVEHKIELDLTSIGVKLVGIIDVLDNQGVIRDLKTAAKTLTQNDADTSQQLTMYSMMQRLSDKPETAVQLDVLVKTKKPKALNIRSTRDTKDVQVLLNRIARAKEGIEKEVWTPAPVGAWWCSMRWCGFADRCPYFAGKVQVAVEE